ncbi:hypothetical protein LSAT2_016861 [Lamellibrachia satsuma]|nr:hypothetical protein LSAT2_016861 [Lamellibrachia satsuma]
MTCRLLLGLFLVLLLVGETRGGSHLSHHDVTNCGMVQWPWAQWTWAEWTWAKWRDSSDDCGNAGTQRRTRTMGKRTDDSDRIGPSIETEAGNVWSHNMDIGTWSEPMTIDIDKK